jgi:AcrR family transcriptional regulator
MKSDNSGQAGVPSRRRDPAIDEEILKTALKLFLEQGVEGANFEQISKRTGIPRSTIYRRWKTRSDLLNATLWSARLSGAGDPNTLSEMEPTEFIRAVEDAIVTALTNPILPKLVAQLIGAMRSHPELLSNYCRQHVEPGWRALFEAIEKAQEAGVVQSPTDPEVLRDILGGAVIHRLISRPGRPKLLDEDREWVKRLMRQIGLTSEDRTKGNPYASLG